MANEDKQRVIAKLLPDQCAKTVARLDQLLASLNSDSGDRLADGVSELKDSLRTVSSRLHDMLRVRGVALVEAAETWSSAVDHKKYRRLLLAAVEDMDTERGYIRQLDLIVHSRIGDLEVERDYLQKTVRSLRWDIDILNVKMRGLREECSALENQITQAVEDRQFYQGKANKHRQGAVEKGVGATALGVTAFFAVFIPVVGLPVAAGLGAGAVAAAAHGVVDLDKAVECEKKKRNCQSMLDSKRRRRYQIDFDIKAKRESISDKTRRIDNIDSRLRTLREFKTFLHGHAESTERCYSAMIVLKQKFLSMNRGHQGALVSTKIRRAEKEDELKAAWDEVARCIRSLKE